MVHDTFNMRLASLPIALVLITSAVAQYFPAEPQNVTVVKSHLQDGVYISYKEVREKNRYLAINDVKTCSLDYAKQHQGCDHTPAISIFLREL